MNRRKIEDVERQKIQRILRGNDYQRITFELVSTKAFQYTGHAGLQIHPDGLSIQVLSIQ